MGYRPLEDKHLQYKVLREMANQHEDVRGQHWTVKLPCHPVNIEVPKVKSDTYIKCPECGKSYLLTHSAVHNKLYSE